MRSLGLILLVVFLWTFVGSSLEQSASGQKMYWSDRGANTLRKADLDGSNVDILVSGLGEARGMDVDFSTGDLFWADNGRDKIQRANADGSNVIDLVDSGLRFPAGVAVDSGGGKLYWADAFNSKIQRSNLDGSQVQDLVTGLRNPYFVTLDLMRGHVYWSDYGADKIQRANLDGSNVRDIITTGLSTTRGIDLDLANNKIYWADRGTDLIQRANLDGSNIETLVTITSNTRDPAPHGVALDVENGHIYWVDNGLVTLRRADLDGSNEIEILGSDSGELIRPWQIVLDLNRQRCDFDEDGACTAQDMDFLSEAVRSGEHRPWFNLNPQADDLVDQTDRQIWINDYLNTSPGDANLDGTVDDMDFSMMALFSEHTGWATGDFNGDGATDVQDFNLWNDAYQTSPAAVPEPSGLAWLGGLMMLVAASRIPSRM